MDPERHIRFLYPPLFLVASVAWGLWLDDAKSITDVVSDSFRTNSSTTILSVVAGGGIVIASLGLLINSTVFAVLSFAFAVRGRSHEALVSAEALKQIQRILGYRRDRKNTDALFLVATFDHDRLSKPIQAWVRRRWNAFNISASSVFALGLALLVGKGLGIAVDWKWEVTSAIVGLVFTFIAVGAWRDVMGMIEFQARLITDISGPSTPE